MATYTDDFNRANGDLGANWTEILGNAWEVEGNAAAYNATTPTDSYVVATYAADLDTNNYTVEATIDKSADNFSSPGVCARMDANGNGYIFVAYADAYYLIELSNNGASEATLDTSGNPGTAPVTLRLEVNGTSLAGYVDDVLTVSATDATYTTGRAGIVDSTFESATGNTIDGFTAADIVSAQNLTAISTQPDTAFGVGSVTPGAVTVVVVSVEPDTALGVAEVSQFQVLSAVSLGSDAAFSVPAITTITNLNALSVSSDEAFSTPEITSFYSLLAISLDNTKTIDPPTITTGPVTIFQNATEADTAFGLAEVAAEAGTVFDNDPNLRGYWPLDEVSGTRFDASGNGNDLTDNNTVGSSTDAQQGARSADFEQSNNERLSITDAAQVGLDITGPLTVLAWVRPESLTAASSTAHTILSKYDVSGDNRSYLFGLRENGGSYYPALLLSAAGTSPLFVAAANTSVAAGTWYFLAAVSNGTDVRLYRNAVLDNTPAAYTAGQFNGNADFEIGSHSAGTWDFDGLIDAVAVFDRALSAVEIAFIYNNGILGALQPPSIPSDEAFGLATVAPGAVSLSAASLQPDAAFGLAEVEVVPLGLAPAELSSDEAFGLASLSVGAVTLSVPSIPSDTAFGAAQLEIGPLTLSALPLASDTAFGMAIISSLGSAQRTLGGEPVLSLDIGGQTLTDYVVAYTYEEFAQQSGGLAIWLDNREGRFNDLGGSWPGLTRGAEVDLRRGLRVSGVPVLVELPRLWVEALQYEDSGTLLLTCIDWWGRLESFRYGSIQNWTSTNIRTIAASILAQVGLTLEPGSFGFSITHEIDTNEDGDDAIREVMDKVEQFLYAGLGGEIRFRSLSSAEAAGYAYDWSQGGGAGHPLLPESEVAEASLEFNRVTVVGASPATGTAENSAEIALLSYAREKVIEDESLTSNAQCLERAQGELSFYEARRVAGTLVARPHFSLRMYDVVSVAAPPWGGPAQAAARVTGIVESYGDGEWEQEIIIGDLPEQSLLYSEEREDKARPRTRKRAATRGKTRKAKKVSRRVTRRRAVTRYSYARRDHTHSASSLKDNSIGLNHMRNNSVGAAELISGSVGSSEIASGAVNATHIATNAVGSSEIAAGAVGSSEIASGAVNATHIATNAVGSSEIAAGAVDTSELADGAVTAAKIASNAVTNAKMADNSVGTAEIVNGAVTSAKLASGAVTATNIANETITTAKLGVPCVEDFNIGNLSIRPEHIQPNAVQYTHLSQALRDLLGI